MPDSHFLSYSVQPAMDVDIPGIKKTFTDSVLSISVLDYSGEELADWASCGESYDHWKGLFSKYDFVTATENSSGKIIGFAAIGKDGYLHSLFVRKDWQGHGVASSLLKISEGMAAGYKAEQVSAEVSKTALQFFVNKGYRVLKKQNAIANRLYLTNYLVSKKIRP